jgi:hypothetical protein
MLSNVLRDRDSDGADRHRTDSDLAPATRVAIMVGASLVIWLAIAFGLAALW